MAHVEDSGMKIGQRQPEAEMRKCEVIFERALSIVAWRCAM